MTVDQRVYFLTTEAKRMLRKTESERGVVRLPADELPVSYILRNIDATLWRRVKAKAALEGVSVKALLERLLRAWVDAPADDAADR